METVLRVAIFYLFVLFGLRVLGKREFSQLAPFELVTLLLIPELAAQALVREDFSVTNALIAISTLFLLVFLTSWIVHFSKRAEKLVGGEPSVVVSDGRFVTRNMDLERVSPDEVYAAMRKVGIERIEQVRWGILETDGKFSFIPFDPTERLPGEPEELAV